MNYWSRDLSAWRLGLGRYLTRRWNGSHHLGTQMASFKIYFMREDTDMAGADVPTICGLSKPVEKVEIWNHQCFDSPLPQIPATSPSPNNTTSPFKSVIPTNSTVPFVQKTP
jgi:hypothetical protein